MIIPSKIINKWAPKSRRHMASNMAYGFRPQGQNKINNRLGTERPSTSTVWALLNCGTPIVSQSIITTQTPPRGKSTN